MKLQTCPHFVIRGAMGLERQIGQETSESPDRLLEEADADAEDRGTSICIISCHGREL
jgi:hypothetical protein